MAVLADLARMPTRQKVMMFIVAGALLGGVYWQFFYKGLVADLESAQAENDSKKAQNQKLEKDIRDLKKWQSEHR